MYAYETEPMTIDNPEVAFAADEAEASILDEAFSADDAAAVGLAFGADEDMAYQLGWSPFKAISGAVKSVAKAAINPVAKVKQGLNLVKSVAKVAKPALPLVKTLVKSPIVKATVAGAAIVFPPVGVPAAAALAVATGVVAATKSSNPQQKAAATQVVRNTAVQAKAGDKGAQVALAAMSNVALAAKARAAAKPPVMAPRPIAAPVRVANPVKPSNVKSRIVVDVLPSGHLSTTRV